jgi:hypothetical protein
MSDQARSIKDIPRCVPAAGVETRRAILDAALDLLETQLQARRPEIAELAGVTRPLLNYHPRARKSCGVPVDVCSSGSASMQVGSGLLGSTVTIAKLMVRHFVEFSTGKPSSPDHHAGEHVRALGLIGWSIRICDRSTRTRRQCSSG